MFTENINKIYNGLASVKFDTLMWILFSAFLAVTAVVIIANFLSPKVRISSKRPYLSFVNAYTALVLASFLTANPLAQSALAAVLFWCIGYFLYGVICFFSKSKKPVGVQSTVAVSAMPTVLPPKEVRRPDVPAAKSSVRLEHAISVTENLLRKNLGKGDRQELEKLKNTLAVLQMKGTLTPSESDILNDNFNALLKLMAKYNV